MLGTCRNNRVHQDTGPKVCSEESGTDDSISQLHPQISGSLPRAGTLPLNDIPMLGGLQGSPAAVLTGQPQAPSGLRLHEHCPDVFTTTAPVRGAECPWVSCQDQVRGITPCPPRVIQKGLNAQYSQERAGDEGQGTPKSRNRTASGHWPSRPLGIPSLHLPRAGGGAHRPERRVSRAPSWPLPG